MNGNVAIIGGTGMEALPPEIFAEPLRVETRFGTVPVLSVSHNYVEPAKLYFLSRHGAGHEHAPHAINYRANTAALVELGVTDVFATNAVGSLRTEIRPGDMVLLDDFIDFTRARHVTLFTDSDPCRHTDFSTPYSPRLRSALVAAAHRMDLTLRERGVYLCCDGPRFETPAEVRLFARWGADVIGMTGLPEAVFAREAGIEYAALALVTNYGAGLTSDPVDHARIQDAVADRASILRELLLEAATRLFEHGA